MCVNRKVIILLLCSSLVTFFLSVIASAAPITVESVFSFRDNERFSPVPLTGTSDNFTIGVIGASRDALTGPTGTTTNAVTSDTIFLVNGISQSAGEIVPIEEERQVRLDVEARGVQYTISLRLPPGWSVATEGSRHSHTLIDVESGEVKTPSSYIGISVEPRLDHADALKQIREFSALVKAENKIFRKIGGWPAMQITRLELRPQPDHGPQHEDPKVTRIQAYIAVGDYLVVVNGGLPSGASSRLIQRVVAIVATLEFETTGNPEEVEAELEALRKPPVLDRGRAPRRVTPQAAEVLTVEAENDALVGDNMRIEPSGFGELEIAVSPDGQNIVVALQSRLTKSSNDAGASFKTVPAFGAGNGDPSVAYGQSGKFYIAWIDGFSGNLMNTCCYVSNYIRLNRSNYSAIL